MNIVSQIRDSELIGSSQLGTQTHRHLQIQNHGLQASSYENSLGNFKSLCNLNYFTSRLPYVLKEREYDLKESNLNKIFTAQWLDERKCIMGTKCNKLLIMDTLTGQYSVQDPIKSPPKSINIQDHCGIHSISINPSRTLLATGADHVNDLAIYSLPDLNPLAVGYKAHHYWIFDLVWLNDDYVVSGSGDNRLALWKASDNTYSSANGIFFYLFLLF